MYTDNNKHKLTNTIGNLLPLSKTINSSLQNYSFDRKKEMRFCDGSHNELEVSRSEDWTSKEILDRGLKIVKFMEKEWDFIIPNLAERKRFLGLDFMIEEDDEWTGYITYCAEKGIEKHKLGILAQASLEKYNNPYPIIYNKRIKS